MAHSPLLALLLLAAPAFAITPDQLQPLEKWAYDQYAAKDPAKAAAFLAARGWVRDCEAVVLDHTKAAGLPDRPAGIEEFKLSEAEEKHVKEALELRAQARSGKLKKQPKEPRSKSVALKPATAAFLKEIGLDPKSPEVKAVSDDSVTTKSGKIKSIELIAAKRDEDGMRRFIATRYFVHQYRKDPKTKFPPTDLYDTSLLTPDEVQFILMQMKQ